VAQGVRIETSRLVLRPPRAEDFDGWAAYMADAEASRWIGGPLSRALAWRGFLTVAGAWAIQGFGMFSVVERETGAWVGRLGPWLPDGWPGPEVGYGIVRSCWGRGYATEGAAAAIDWALEALGWTEVNHFIDPANAASIRVAERLGARRRGVARLPEPFDARPVEAWGQTDDEWRSRRGGTGRGRPPTA
jgi:RimJ/RimL family protein N-acetyltransferase